MIHARAATLSVFSASLMTLGALADLNDEGRGGPDDWLESGVQAMNEELAQELFTLTNDDVSLQYLIAEEQEKGIHLISIVRLSETLNDETLEIQTENIGMYVEYQSLNLKGREYSKQTINIKETVNGTDWQEITQECDIELCVRPACTVNTLTLKPMATVGMYTGFDGTQSYILGRIGKTQASVEDGSETTEGLTLFLPNFTAETMPENTDINLIKTWHQLRFLSVNGAVQMNPNQVDEIYESLAAGDPPFLVGAVFSHSCDARLQRCLKQAEKNFHRALFWCFRSQSAKLERVKIIGGLCMTGGLAISGVLKKVFAAAGLCVGGPKAAAVGGATGYVLGFGYGAATGLVAGTCVANFGEDLCAQDARHLFESDVAQCHGDWMECYW